MDERFDFGNKFFDAAEGTPTDGLLGDDVEPDFYLVEPGRVGGRLPAQEGKTDDGFPGFTQDNNSTVLSSNAFRISK